MKNKAKKSVKILSGITALMLTASMGLSTTFAFGAEKNTKDESVYVITNSDGSQNDIIVSDHLYNKTGSETLTDMSNLSNIENVKGDEKYTKDENGSLIWKAGGNDIYYQGNSDKTAPVKMSIEYYLNGKQVTAKTLKGKSGDVKIVVDFENTTDVPFIAMTGFLASDDTMKNIKVSSGRVIDDGEKQIVVGMAAPGLAENLGVSASKIGFSSQVVFTGKAEKFSVDSMMTMVTSDIFEDIDTSQLASLDMDGQIELLDSSAKKLVSGSNELYSGINYMNSKSQELTVGVKKLDDGAAELSQELNTNLGNMKAGAVQLQTGSTAIYNALNTLQSKINGDGTAANPGLAAGALSIANGMTEINTNSNQGSQADAAALKILTDNETALKAALGDQNYNALKNSVDGSKQIHDGIAAKTAENTGALRVGAKSVSDGVAGIQGALNGDGTAVNPGLVNAAKQVMDGSGNLAEGLTEATADTKSLTSGAKDLAAGMEEMSKSTGTLIAGVNKLNIGSRELSSGMEKFYREGITKIVKLYNSDLKGITQNLNSTINAGKDYTTFTQLPAGMNGSVKFIYKTELK